ncbi:hypothetical protein [Streptomyces sp. CNQ085]|uniref:hypothetical protein n=1 Tax=Streptomyces sp. CNQ085 TaxID=2886944 RepID=UPI0027E3C01B|nr:hypothetical protein [Streptomyces sp. CNQ085]
MPTPYGSRGAMILGPDELRALRGALALVLRPARPSAHAGGECPEGAAKERAEVVRACLWLADALDEASREADRLRAFLRTDLDRYRAALPGSAPGYLALLEEAVALGCTPCPEDLEALREPCGRWTDGAGPARAPERGRTAPGPHPGRRPAEPPVRWRSGIQGG